jgi:ASC-1-like (ASCH) protein
MTKYPCSSIDLKFAFFDNVVDSFIGQKVIVSFLDNEVIGQVYSCTLEQVKVKLFGDIKSFRVSQTHGNFIDSFIEIPLSPSLLGRQIDLFGNPIDDLPPIIPISKTASFYIEPKLNSGIKSEIVSDKDWLIKTEAFSVQKGEVKTYKNFNDLLQLLNISNLVLLVVELDYQSKKFKNVQQDLKENNLDQISIFIMSDSQNSLSAAPYCISQVANYLSNQLGFDVLIAVSHCELLNNADTNGFYFMQHMDQLARFQAGNSITVINI